MNNYDLVVIGGGPAGLAAAYSAWQEGNGRQKILILERERELGGILNQCIHNGFGLHYFKEELTGPEYAQRFISLLGQTGVEVKTDTMVLSVTQDRQIAAVSQQDGYIELQAKAIVLAMGCRERTRGAISIPGDRPSGVFTAGTAQRYINVEGYMVGRRVVILGSGDIGLIMARRLTLEGAKVLAVVELMPYSNGLNRNIVQCLQDYDIPLLLSHTITHIRGRRRVEGVTVSQVDESRRPIPGTEKEFDCDTVLLSVGLIPENELSKSAHVELDSRTSGAVVYENMETSVEGIFACGNVLHVHDLVDYVTAESIKAGRAAAQYIQSGEKELPSLSSSCICLKNGENLSYVLPQKLRPERVEKFAEVFFRVNRVVDRGILEVCCGDQVLMSTQRDCLVPAQMERCVLPKSALERCSGEELVFRLRSSEDQPAVVLTSSAQENG